MNRNGHLTAKETYLMALVDATARAVHRLSQLSGTEELLRGLVEVARHRLQLERVAVFQRDARGRFHGLLGSDARGRLQEEKKRPMPAEYVESVRRRAAEPEIPYWWLEQAQRYAWEEGRNVPLGRGWVSFTVVKEGDRPTYAVVVSDSAVTGAPFDPMRQSALAMLGAFVATHLERVRLIGEIEREHAQLLAIFDGLEEGVYVVDMDTYEVLFCNRYLKDLFGRDPVGGKCYREFQHRDRPCDFCTNDWLRSHPGQTLRWEYYNPILQRHYLLFDRMIRWPDRSNVRFEIAIDITEQKKLEEERLRERALQEAMSTKSEVLSQVAHELRTPMNVLLGTVQASLRGVYGDLTPQQKAAFDRIYESGRMLAALIDDLLTVGREVKGEMVLQRGTVPVSVLIRSLLPLVEAELSARNIQLVLRVPEKLEHREVTVDQRRIQQVLVNLILNAARHSPSRAQVILEASEIPRRTLANVEQNLGSSADRWLRISVTDFGPGLTSTECEAIFHGLKSPDAARAAPRPLHLGVGLPLSRKIAVLHGGWLWAESEGRGRGSTFHLVLPMEGNGEAR